MQRAFAALVIATSTMFLGLAANADSLDVQEATDLLAGRTWQGENADGARFWFYHAPDGSFRAKFIPGYSGKEDFSGKWFKRGSDLCWAWDGWKTFCYYKFETQGDNLAMTRNDQVVQTGRIVDGNSEGL